MTIEQLAKQTLKSLSTVKNGEARKLMLQAVGKALQGKDVKKDVDPDLQNAIAEIASMFDSLQMMTAGEGEIELGKTEDDNLDLVDKEGEETEEEKAARLENETIEDKVKRLELEKSELEKSLAVAKESSPDGATGSDNAEDRKDEDLTPATDTALAQVSKNNVMNSLIINGMKDIAKAIGDMNSKIGDHGNAIDNILKDFGVEDTLKKELDNGNIPKVPVNKTKPVINTDDSTALLAGINKQLSDMNGKGGKKEEEDGMNKNTIRKNLRPLLSEFLTYRPSVN